MEREGADRPDGVFFPLPDPSVDPSRPFFPPVASACGHHRMAGGHPRYHPDLGGKCSRGHISPGGCHGRVGSASSLDQGSIFQDLPLGCKYTHLPLEKTDGGPEVFLGHFAVGNRPASGKPPLCGLPSFQRKGFKWPGCTGGPVHARCDCPFSAGFPWGRTAGERHPPGLPLPFLRRSSRKSFRFPATARNPFFSGPFFVLSCLAGNLHLSPFPSLLPVVVPSGGPARRRDSRRVRPPFQGDDPRPPQPSPSGFRQAGRQGIPGPLISPVWGCVRDVVLFSLYMRQSGPGFLRKKRSLPATANMMNG